MTTEGERIRALREQLGMSRTSLARRAGVSPAHISGIELGKSGVSLPVLRGIAQGLAVSVGVLTGDEPMPGEEEHKASKRAANGLAPVSPEPEDARMVHSYRGYQELAADFALLAGAGVTPTELAALGEVAVTVEREPTKQEVLSLLLFLRQWSKGAI